jgi:RHS repeat-associated protein
MNLPATVSTYDGAGVLKAQTTYGYDESSLASSGITTQHDSAPPGGTFRGNQTSVSKYLSTGALTCQDGTSGGSGSNIISRATYFDTGATQTLTDPCHHQISYAYSSTFVGAYPTQITNTLGQSTSTSYDFSTGLVTSTTDLNSQVTTFSYDQMRRHTAINHPDGGQETFTYDESTQPFDSVATKKINSAQTLTTKYVVDGLGRLSQSQLTSDPQGTVYTTTTYDFLGRVTSVTNPYRSGADITTSTGTTTFAYDALNRKTSETYPDGSVLHTAYCGASTLVTDPTGKWRRSRTDGLGRLVEVDEPNSTTASVASTGCPGSGEPIWITTYGYDTLGNLTSVLQNGSHSRSFTYDSLSRLLTSNNPEVGIISYSYWPDGPVHSKTDARSIITTYAYDSLHREKSTSYSNGDPAISTNYDEVNCLGLSACQNIGHSTSMTDAAGSESWAYQIDAANHRSVHVNKRTTSRVTKTSTYYLDLAGNITQMVYPTGRVVNYSYDNADRPIKAADGSNGITYATGSATSPGGTCLPNVTCYTPQGTFYALSVGQSGSFTGLNFTHKYNNRLQPQEFKASSAGGNAMDLSYNFTDPVTLKNAGHVYGTVNNLDTSRSQTFSYDQLNRITGALGSTYATSPAHCWGEAFGLDSWGNLQSITATTTPGYTGCSQESGFSQIATSANRMPSFGYDASGNTASDGVNAYTWDGESQLKTAGGMTYTYDGEGRRASKVGTKLYWYGSGGEILAETDASGATTAEYIFFGGKRIASLGTGPAALQNSSFETYNTLDQGCACGPFNYGPIPGWTINGSGGSWQPSASTYSSFPAGPTVIWNGGGTISQTLAGIGLQPNTTYTLSVYVGHRLDGYVNTYTVSLQAGSTVLKSVSASNSTITAGTFANVSLTYTTGSTVTSGDLTIVLSSGGSQIDFDNVRLSGVAVPNFYTEDLLGTSRAVTTESGVVCYDADFYPYGGERPYTNTCSPTYKFEGKERDTETGNDNFGARSYSNRFGRWLSSDWSAVPVAVPYANLTNPQTLNLYSMVADDPESFADLDGHTSTATGADDLHRDGTSSEYCGTFKNSAECTEDTQKIDQKNNTTQAQNQKTEVAIGIAKEVANTLASVAPGSALVGNPFSASNDTQAKAMMATAIAGLLIPGGGEEEVAAKVESKIGQVAAERVTELASSMGKSKNFITLAITETKEGIRVVSSSENALRPAVRAMLKEGEIAVKGAGHAEVTGAQGARQLGLTPTGTAASRGICSSCAAVLKEIGIQLLSNLK